MLSVDELKKNVIILMNKAHEISVSDKTHDLVGIKYYAQVH